MEESVESASLREQCYNECSIVIGIVSVTLRNVRLRGLLGDRCSRDLPPRGWRHHLGLVVRNTGEWTTATRARGRHFLRWIRTRGQLGEFCLRHLRRPQVLLTLGLHLVGGDHPDPGPDPVHPQLVLQPVHQTSHEPREPLGLHEVSSGPVSGHQVSELRQFEPLSDSLDEDGFSGEVRLLLHVVVVVANHHPRPLSLQAPTIIVEMEQVGENL